MRYLAICKLRNDKSTDRISVDLAQWVATIETFADGRREMAYRTEGGYEFGIVFQTDRDVSKLDEQIVRSRYFLDGDSIVIVEVGNLISGRGAASRLWTWLQRHP